MNTHQEKEEIDWEKGFWKLWEEGNYGYNHIGSHTMRDFIQQIADRMYKAGYADGVKSKEI